ncbi:kinase-like domain-containing protein [Pelagophyceae sp. CCMP2097]|nr:kinase-like domain-containing protein [Pelagophyceae sp. CCMP2097]
MPSPDKYAVPAVAARSSFGNSPEAKRRRLAFRAPATPPGTEYTPLLVAKYDVGPVLGAGSFGEVRRAVRRVDGLAVAVKLVRGGGAQAAAKAQASFEHEIRILRELCALAHHPHLVHLVECFHGDGGSVALVLELCEGGDLFDHVLGRNGAHFTEAAVAGWVRQVAVALQALHGAGILHRDIKPENLLFKTKRREVLALADYGLAFAGPCAAASGHLVGTLAYMAPEILERDAYTPACDIWGLGCVAHLLLAGFPLVDGCDSREAQLQALKQATPLDATADDWGHVSGRAKRFLSRCLDADPQRRASLADVLADPWLAPGGAGPSEGDTGVAAAPRIRAAFARLKRHQAQSKFRGAARSVLLSLSSLGLRHGGAARTACDGDGCAADGDAPDGPAPTDDDADAGGRSAQPGSAGSDASFGAGDAAVRTVSLPGGARRVALEPLDPGALGRGRRIRHHGPGDVAPAAPCAAAAAAPRRPPMLARRVSAFAGAIDKALRSAFESSDDAKRAPPPPPSPRDDAKVAAAPAALPA